MMRSMYAGVSGLKVHQTRMDVIGNNIANVNTIGFKASRVTFKDILSQTVKGASAPQNNRGGTNPMEVGLGVGLGSIDVNHTPGNLQTTNIQTDLAIDGNGFFIYNDGSRDFYSRAGALTIDDDGNLVNTLNGYKIQGWQADTNGVIDINTPITSINIPRGQVLQAAASTELDISGNINPDQSTFTVSADLVDSQGKPQTVVIELNKTAPNNWDWEAQWEDNTGTVNVVGSGSISFDGAGDLTTGMPIASAISFNPTGVDPMNLELDFTGLTQAYGASSFDVSKNGYPMGSFESITINGSGTVVGTYSNGRTKPLAQIALATFDNPAGLSKAGDSMFAVTTNSGDPDRGIAGSGGRGEIAPGNLEMSNVDLAEQFTDMITTQRGFQANSKIIQTADQMLQDLVNIKR
ncbi:MAG: flagellar hook protein FlgE [Halanaerobium sp.]|nr:flagellar hook protein FlgE [Halanaerobium sp.]